jgi:hypothetical protein
MEVFLNDGNGISLRIVDSLADGQLLATNELKEKFKSFVKPTIFNNDIIESATPKEIESHKLELLAQLNQMQFEELSKTDWAYIRERELNIDVPIEIVEERKAIREKFNKLKKLLITIDLNDEQGTI